MVAQVGEASNCLRLTSAVCGGAMDLTVSAFFLPSSQLASLVRDPATCFMNALVDFVFSGRCHIDHLGGMETSHFRFRPDDVILFLGTKSAHNLAETVCSTIREQQGRKCKKDAKAFVKEAILLAMAFNKDSRSIYKKRKTSARIEYTFLDSSLFGDFTKEGKGAFLS